LVQGTVLVAGQDAFVMFDCSATHFFISVAFAKHLELNIELLNHALDVYNLVGIILIPDMDIELHGQNLPVNFILLDMIEYNIILVMH
jgi:hypothetical protein